MKILFENKQLNEGPGAGYTVSGTLTNVKVDNIKNIEVVSKDEDIVEYEVELDATATFEDVRADSYYYGGDIESTPVSIIRARINSDNKPTVEEVKDAIEGAKINVTLGGGWSHSTFDGFIEGDLNKSPNSIDTYESVLDGILFELTDKRAIEYLDRAVQGETTYIMYQVITDGYGDQVFEDENQAIAYAKKIDAKEVRVLYQTEFFDGGIDDEFADTVWTNDGMEESLTEALSDVELDDMAAFLDKFFAKQKIDDIIIEVKDGHLFAKDSEGNKWKDAQLYDFIVNEVLAFDEDGKLSDGIGAAEPFVDRIKKDAAKFGVTITPTKKSTNEGFDDIQKETDDGLSIGSAKEMSNVIFDTLFNNTQYPQFDFSKVENQEVDANKGQIVFDYMGHEYKITVEEVSGHFTESIGKPLTESVSEEDRINALATYLGIEPSEISVIYDYEFETPEGDYLIVDEDEARELAEEDIKNIFDDIGMESFTESFRDWIMMNALDYDWFEETVRESYESYVEDIEDEASSMGYDNRLIEEMHDHQVLSDDDFEIDEDGEPNLRELKEDIDIDDKREEFIDLLVENAGHPVEYCADNFGWDWVSRAATENNLIDMDEVVDECILQDGIAHFIARYDGDEIELENGLYAYRTN